jgi:hypothetical protein
MTVPWTVITEHELPDGLTRDSRVMLLPMGKDEAKQKAQELVLDLEGDHYPVKVVALVKGGPFEVVTVDSNDWRTEA